MKIEYTAYNSSGKKIKDNSSQDTMEQFYRFIENNKLILIDYRIRNNKKSNNFLIKNKYENLANLCSYLFYIESSGLPINKGMILISKSIKDKKFKRTILSIIDDVNNGKEFYKCFLKHPMYFSHFFVEMIHTGEKTDNLKEVFKQLMNFYKEMYTTTKELEKNLIYPLIVLVTAIASMILMRVIFIPEILSLLENNSSTISMSKNIIATKFLMSIAGLIFSIVALIFIMRKVKFDYCQKKIYKLIPKGSLINLIFRFKFLNSLFLAAICGESLSFGYEMALDSVKSKYFKSQIKSGFEVLKYGNSLSESLEYIDALDNIIIATISIGEETNSLENALKKSIEDSKMAMNNRLKKISVMVEPIIMILLGAFITYYAVSVFLPIMDNLNNI